MKKSVGITLAALATALALAPLSAAPLEGKVTFWSMWTTADAQSKVIDAAVADFKAANPKVEVEVKYNGRTINQLLKPALESGAAIDVFEQDPDKAFSALKDSVYKLDDLLAMPALDTPGKTIRESLVPALINSVKASGKLSGLDGYYALPQQPWAVLFFYNKDLFDKAGIKSAPTTWADFLTVCAALKKIGVAPVTFDDAYQELFLGGYLGSAMGSDWVEALVKDKTGEQWKSPTVVQFAKDIQTMAEKGYFAKNIAGSKYPAGQQELAIGKVAMYLNGTWLPSEVVATAGPEFRWGEFQFPEIKGGNGKGGLKALSYGFNGLLVNKNSKNIPATLEFIRYLVSKKSQEAMATQAQAIPATINSQWPAVLKDSEAAFKNAEVRMPWGASVTGCGDFFGGSVQPIFMELVSGKLKAEAYVNKMAAAAKSYYKNK